MHWHRQARQSSLTIICIEDRPCQKLDANLCFLLRDDGGTACTEQRHIMLTFCTSWVATAISRCNGQAGGSNRTGVTECERCTASNNRKSFEFIEKRTDWYGAGYYDEICQIGPIRYSHYVVITKLSGLNARCQCLLFGVKQSKWWETKYSMNEQMGLEKLWNPVERERTNEFRESFLQWTR